MGATNNLLPTPKMGKYINNHHLGPFSKKALSSWETELKSYMLIRNP